MLFSNVIVVGTIIYRTARFSVDNKYSLSCYDMEFHREPFYWPVRKDITVALYADRMVMWCTEDYSSTTSYRMQQAVDILAKQAKNGILDSIKINLQPCSPWKRQVPLIMEIITTSKMTNLPTEGLILTVSRPHIQDVETKGKWKLDPLGHTIPIFAVLRSRPLLTSSERGTRTQYRVQ